MPRGTCMLLACLLAAAVRTDAQLAEPIAVPGDTAAAVLRYHAASSRARKDTAGPPPAAEAQPPFKKYARAVHIALPRGELGGRTLGAVLRGPAPRTAALTLAELGEILYLAAGVTGRSPAGRPLRAAPSAGGLFSGELYLLVWSGRPLAPGIYHYDAEQHRLDVLGPVAAGARAAPAGQGDMDVVLTSVLRRTVQRYGNRTFRYVAVEGGHLLENLRLASHAAGMRAVLLARFDDAGLARVLGVDRSEEPVLAVMRLGRAGPGPVRAPRPDRGGDALAARGTADRAPSAASGMPVRQAIALRRSQRQFATTPVPLATLAGLMGDLVPSPQLSHGVRLRVIVNRVAGLAPGLYRYDGQHELVRLQAGPMAPAAQAAALAQPVIGNAAVVLVLSAMRDHLLAGGATGYRNGLIETGMIGERWLLGAVARGLDACPVGSFYDDEAAALVHADPEREWVLHFAALGVPANPPAAKP